MYIIRKYGYDKCNEHHACTLHFTACIVMIVITKRRRRARKLKMISTDNSNSMELATHKTLSRHPHDAQLTVAWTCK